MADSKFKSIPISFPEEWEDRSNGQIIGSDQYKPDRSFKDQNGKIVCVAESTNTNDRKVGIGELCLADKFFTDEKVCGTLIFSLCGQSKYPPTPETQSAYLEPYFKHLQNNNKCYGVKEIYFINESDLKSLRWVALNPRI